MHYNKLIHTFPTWLNREGYYWVRKLFRESYLLQDSEIPIASTETNDTSDKALDLSFNLAP